MANKVRKVDLSPDEFLVGITGMTPEEIAVYTVSIMLQYSSGGEIPWDDERMMRVIKARPTNLRKVAAALIARGKLSANGEKVVNKRVVNELKAASNRIENAEKAARIRWEKEHGIEANQSSTDAGAYNSALPSLTPPSSPSPIKESPSLDSDGPKVEFGKIFDEQFWPAYPSRGQAQNPKKPARLKFVAACNRGEDPHAIVAAVKAYAANPTTKIGTEFVKTAEVWLSKECWKDQQPAQVVDLERPAGFDADDARWLMRLKGAYWMKHQWGPKDINDPDCKIPRHVYEHWVSTADVGPVVPASQQVLRRA